MKYEILNLDSGDVAATIEANSIQEAADLFASRIVEGIGDQVSGDAHQGRILIRYPDKIEGDLYHIRGLVSDIKASQETVRLPEGESV